MRISRGCYDKFHRCPGWAGGGLYYAQVQTCDNGRVEVDYGAPFWKLRFWRCRRCPVVVLPYASRWLDPSWLIDCVVGLHRRWRTGSR